LAADDFVFGAATVIFYIPRVSPTQKMDTAHWSLRSRDIDAGLGPLHLKTDIA
jgi:hypothetical protein